MNDPELNASADNKLIPHLRLAIDAVRGEQAPAMAMDRALQNARGIGPLPKRRWHYPVRRVLAVAGLAAALFIGIGVWMMRPAHSWADVVKAVQSKPWLHIYSKEPGGKDWDMWLSPTHCISATRYDRHYEHFDHRLRIYHTYDADEGNVYRLPEFRGQRRDAFLAMHDIIDALLRTQTDPRKAALTLLCLNDAKCKLLWERQNQTKDGHGRQWLEHEMSIKCAELPDPVHLIIRIDPKTSLPHSVRMEGRIMGQAVAKEELFDYPDKGPADIYSLGVPPSAKLIDRIPTGDLARLLDGVKAARDRFDDYAAIVVESSSKERWWDGKPIRVWRKGRKWRYDFPLVWHISDARPGPGAEMGRWWQDRVKEVRWKPVMACDGKTNFWFTTSVKETPATTGDDYIPVAYSWMPEYLSHPPMGLPGPNSDPVIEPNPRDGPPGTVLLRVRHRVTEAEARSMKNAHLPPMPDLYRYWIDPSRSYVAMRWQMGENMHGKLSGDEYVMENLAQSPSGFWYPTVVRQLNAIQNTDGTVSDQIQRFFLDFSAVMPDSLFDGKGTEVKP